MKNKQDREHQKMISIIVPVQKEVIEKKKEKQKKPQPNNHNIY